MEDLVAHCQKLLYTDPNAKPALEYLDSRLPRDIQNIFQFGYLPKSENFADLFIDIPEQSLIDNKIAYNKSYCDISGSINLTISNFENYPLIMPYKNTYGKIIGLVGRTLLSEQERKLLSIDKYKNTAGLKKGNYLYGLYENKEEILKQGYAIVVEGQFDLIKAYQKGIRNLVALGNANMTAMQFCLISRYTDTLHLLLDKDEAGEKGMEKIMKKYSDYALIKIASLPDGYKDIDEFLSENDDLVLNLS